MFFSIYGPRPTCQHELGSLSAEAHPLTHSLIHLLLPLSTPQEQGWTLELERERIGREKRRGRKEGSTNTTSWTPSIFPILFLVSSIEESYFLIPPPKSDPWFFNKKWRNSLLMVIPSYVSKFKKSSTSSSTQASLGLILDSSFSALQGEAYK